MIKLHPRFATILVSIVASVIPHASFGQVLPDFSQATFIDDAQIDNPFFPLIPGTVFTYEGETPDGIERIETTVTFDTRKILGVETTVIRDRAWLDDLLVEDTFDWYAQDTDGNIWYFGEDTIAYEYDEFGTVIEKSKEGSWKAGRRGAQPGWIMEANPQIGDSYYQEYAVGIAEDEAEVLSLTESVTGPLGNFQNVLKTLDSTKLEPDLLEHKLYASEIGLIRVEEELDDMGNPAFILDLVGVTLLDNDDGDKHKSKSKGKNKDQNRTKNAKRGKLRGSALRAEFQLMIDQSSMAAELATFESAMTAAAMQTGRVPEPASWVLAIVGLSPLWWNRRIRNDR